MENQKNFVIWLESSSNRIGVDTRQVFNILNKNNTLRELEACINVRAANQRAETLATELNCIFEYD
jgi:hypothetical protein